MCRYLDSWSGQFEVKTLDQTPGGPRSYLTRSYVRYFRCCIDEVHLPLTFQYRAWRSGHDYFSKVKDRLLGLLHNQSGHRVWSHENPSNRESDFHSSVNRFNLLSSGPEFIAILYGLYYMSHIIWFIRYGSSLISWHVSWQLSTAAKLGFRLLFASGC